MLALTSTWSRIFFVHAGSFLGPIVGPLGVLLGSKTIPKATQVCPRPPPDRPKTAPRPLMTAPRPPKTAPRAPEITPRWLQDRPRSPLCPAYAGGRGQMRRAQTLDFQCLAELVMELLVMCSRSSVIPGCGVLTT